MKRDELPEVLFKKVKEVGLYPNGGVKEVRRMLDGTAFFSRWKGGTIEYEKMGKELFLLRKS